MFKHKVKLAETQEAFEAQAEWFLSKHGLPTDQETKGMYASFVQCSDQNSNYIDSKLVASQVRKQLANKFAFYMMHPDKKPKNESKDITAAVVQEVKG